MYSLVSKSGLETENLAVEIHHADHVAPLYQQKVALTSPTNGRRSAGIVRSRTKSIEFSLVLVSKFEQSAVIIKTQDVILTSDDWKTFKHRNTHNFGHMLFELLNKYFSFKQTWIIPSQ
jgi:hypothetical protein